MIEDGWHLQCKWLLRLYKKSKNSKIQKDSSKWGNGVRFLLIWLSMGFPSVEHLVEFVLHKTVLRNAEVQALSHSEEQGV